MNNAPVLSIAVPVHNAQATLCRCLDALLAQRERRFELLLIDDGSTDSSAAVCDGYARRDPRVHVVHKRNGGAGSARNAGIRLARGTYIAFPDADDVAEPALYERLLRAACEHQADLAVCGYFWHTPPQAKKEPERVDIRTAPAVHLEGQEAVRAQFFAWIPASLSQSPWNKLYRREVILRHNLRFPALRRGQDAYFNCEYFGAAESCVLVEKPLYHYMSNDFAAAARKYPADIFDLFTAIHRHYYERRKEWGLDPALDAIISEAYLYAVIECLSASDSKEPSAARRRAYAEQIAGCSLTRYAARAAQTGNAFVRLVMREINAGRGWSLPIILRARAVLKRTAAPVWNGLKRLNR